MDPEESGFLEAGLRPVRPTENVPPARVAGQNACRECGLALGRQWVFCKHCGTEVNPEEPNEDSLSHGVTTDSQDGVEPTEESKEENDDSAAGVAGQLMADAQPHAESHTDCREEGEEGRNPVAVREVVKVS